MPCPDCDHGDECPRAVSRYPQQTGDLLGVNEWQEGQKRPFKQVRASMSGDQGLLRMMWLLPFAAAANKACLMLKRHSSRVEWCPSVGEVAAWPVCPESATTA